LQKVKPEAAPSSSSFLVSGLDGLYYPSQRQVAAHRDETDLQLAVVSRGNGFSQPFFQCGRDVPNKPAGRVRAYTRHMVRTREDFPALRKRDVSSTQTERDITAVTFGIYLSFTHKWRTTLGVTASHETPLKLIT
jgi:hypothetical protein